MANFVGAPAGGNDSPVFGQDDFGEAQFGLTGGDFYGAGYTAYYAPSPSTAGGTDSAIGAK